MVLLLGKMLCSVVNSAPLSSHLLIQKTFSHAVKFDIFKEPGIVSHSTHQKLNIAYLFHGGGRAGETLAPQCFSRNVKSLALTFLHRCLPVSLSLEITSWPTQSLPSGEQGTEALSTLGRGLGPWLGLPTSSTGGRTGQKV